MSDIICGDCVNVLPTLEPASIDLILTSPPYDAIRDYKGVKFDFDAIAPLLVSVLAKGGVMVWVVGDSTVNGSESLTSFRQVIRFRELGLNVHDTMIYASDKPPLTRNRYEQKFEYMFVLSNGRPKTFNPIMEPCTYAGKDRSTHTYRHDSRGVLEPTHRDEPVKQQKIRGNIWYITSGWGKSSKDKIAYQHPAIFPEQLALDHIQSWTNLGDLVLDPFCGSGTTLKAATMLGRRSIGIDVIPEYCELARQRVALVTGVA